MIDILTQVLFIISDLLNVTHLFIPSVGVGGGIEAKESVDLLSVIKFTLIFLAGIGVIFGFGLAIAAKRFSVKVDPRVEQVKDVLAHAHCGACGYAGCEQYAEAVVKNPDVPVNLCVPAGARAAEKIAIITGKKAEFKEREFARVFCQGGHENSTKRFKYEGILDCRAVVLAGGGDKSCNYGCLGYGTCAKVCPFGAIKMSENGLPQIDEQKCTGCKKCQTACPKKVIEVLPASKAVFVSCHSKDKGVDTRKYCQQGCIACGICVKVCPYEAVRVVDNLASIDVGRCRVCGICVTKCPTKAIVDFIPNRGKAYVTERCIGCQSCKKICPVDASDGQHKQRHTINQDRCIGCGICTSRCPVQAIQGTFNWEVVYTEAQKKKMKSAA
ncbi:MAG: Fe-S cluster domain-containing protein [Thermodesulfovibrionales bacterium]|nr:Fe-S cluster domain-containing protein [Thermodesulfovibrionales bacterium]